MHKIYFYRDKNGNEPVYDYIKELKQKSDKDSKIKAAKIQYHIQALSEHGTFIGAPMVKHLEGDIWELRPLQDRIFFAAWVDGGFILLHHFVKRSQKTPRREIDRAKRELAEMIERGDEHEDK